MSGSERLILVGGGHAHVEVLRRLAAEPLELASPVEVVLVSDRAHAIYSGMVPGFAAGHYQSDEIAVDVAALAARARARWLPAHATRIDPAKRFVELEGGAREHYTIASLDVGSTVAGLDTPGVRQHALASRPIAELVERLERIRAAGPIAVVGGGAAGVELACCLRERLLRETGNAPAMMLVDAGEQILSGASTALRRSAEKALRERRIAVRLRARVCAVDATGIRLAHGDGDRDADEDHIRADLVIWATGAAPHAFLRDGSLPLDGTGFVRVAETLEVPGCDNLFAVGDCAGFPGTRKAGVYAVRQGPVLHANLCARLRGEALQTYVPQQDFLQLLNLGDGSAIAAKWGMALRARAAMRLKDRIDRAWMARYA